MGSSLKYGSLLGSFFYIRVPYYFGDLKGGPEFRELPI